MAINSIPSADEMIAQFSSTSEQPENILKEPDNISSSVQSADSMIADFYSGEKAPEVKQPTEVEVDEKPTPATLGNNEVWLDAAKKIYEDEVGGEFDPDKATDILGNKYDTLSDWFENRHSKYNWNIVNMLQTGFNVDEKSDDVKRAWLDSMSLYDESDTDVGDFFRAAKNIVLDPTTIASLLATLGVGTVAKLGGQKGAALIAKVSFKENLRKQLKDKVSKETIEEVLKTKGSKDILAETLKTARNKAALQTMGYKSIGAVPIMAGYASAADIAAQEMEINAETPETIAERYDISLEEGAQKLQELKDEGYDLKRLALMTGIGAVTGFALGSLPTYIGGKLGMSRALGKSKEGAKDLVEVIYRPIGSSNVSIKKIMDKSQYNAAVERGLRGEDGGIDPSNVKFKEVTEVIKPEVRPGLTIDSEELIERTLPNGHIARTIRRKITEVLGETGAKKLGKINTLLGRAITSTAGLPPFLARVARRRSNIVRSADVKIEAAIKGLKNIQKKENVSTDAIRKFINENDDSLLRIETDKTETLTKLEEIKKSIF
jgi:hypothetical protein